MTDRARVKRDAAILRWRARGWSYGRIAARFGLTRQRVQQIVKASER